MPPLLARALLLPVATALLVIVFATPASAHGRGSDATNFASGVTSAPQLDGVAWHVVGGDEYLTVTNTSDQPLIVLGYQGEPYLRVGPDGVFENRNSPATYLNRDRYRTDLPPGVAADAQAEPDWVRISEGRSAYWHDHRIHWMSPNPPPVVAQAPGEPHQVLEWEVPFTHGGQAHAVRGELRWVPGPSPWPWLAAGVLLTLPALAGLRARPGPQSWVRRVARPAAVVLAVVSVLNLLHLVDDLFAAPAPAPALALAAVQTALFIAIGLFGAVKGWQGGDGAFTALGVGAGAILVGQGLLYAPVLGASQITSVFPAWLGRLAVAASIGQALSVGTVAVLGTRRMLPPAEAVEQPDVASARP